MASRKKWALGFGIIAVAVVLASLTTAGAGAQQQSAFALPRNATLYTSGTAWGPFASSTRCAAAVTRPARPGSCTRRCSGTTRSRTSTSRGSRPSGKWVGRTYVVTLRQGVKWSDGKPFTGADVKFTFETGKLAGSELSTMWKTGLSNIIVKGNTVSFVFAGKPNYLDWNTNIYSWRSFPSTLEELQRDRHHDR